ncbi:MAG: HDOD domain-containing protein [Syntrophobacterales bacterium]|jgi:HD-like signal output (HDOD) protein|nr:HDOD domain-containing protein [Syntrophobacterales bacterium]
MPQAPVFYSPIYGFPGRISYMSQGVVPLLGLKVIKGLFLGICAFNRMQKTMIGLWEYCFACLSAARVLAKKKEIKEFKEVSISGGLLRSRESDPCDPVY